MSDDKINGKITGRKLVEKFLEQDPDAYKNYQSLQEIFKRDPEMAKSVSSIVQWHTNLIQTQLLQFAQKVIPLLAKDSRNYNSKAFNILERSLLK